MRKTAGLLYGRDDGHLDHLAPLCSLLQIPLYFTSKTLYSFAQKQYFGLESILAAPNAVAGLITENYDSLLSTLPRQLIDPIFLFEEITYQKRLHSYWLPHGASDKENMLALTDEDTLLIYGEKMKGMLPTEAKEKTQSIGNFRLKYFQTHRSFYKELLQTHFKNTLKGQNILYAPSWESNHIEKWVHALIIKKPEGANLFIKLHPNSYKQGGLSAIAHRYEGLSGVYFIENFFPIYPLLSIMDSLYTDISSIGYDFLYFDAPLYFTEEHTSPLNACGSFVDKNSPYTNQPSDDFKEKRGELYAKTFVKAATLQIM